MARRILGAILAGGRSTRFGSDKALALLDGRSLIEHAAAAIAPHVEKLVICGRSDPRWTCLPDQPAPGMGPLGGLAAALLHAQEQGFDGVLSTGCDMPSLPGELVEALIGNRAGVVEGQQLIGYWPAALADRLLGHLDRCERRSIREWMAVVEPRIVVPHDPLPNINRPQDLAAWVARR